MIGRPLRFLVLTTSGWIAVRVALLWPTIDSIPALIRAMAPPVAAATASFAVAPSPSPPPSVRTRPVERPNPPIAQQQAPTTSFALSDATPAAPPGAEPDPPLQPPPLRLPGIVAPQASHRLQGSVWAVARGGPGEARPGNQLGGSQAGIRLTYGLARKLTLAGRLSSTLDGRQREAALGLDWQPGALPLHLIVERRIALDGGRGGTAAMAIAGIDPRPLAPGLTVEAYAQGGAVLRDRIEPFADGALRVTRRLVDDTRVRVDIGLGSWTAAQRGASRVDVGPTLSIAIPVARQRMRMTLDWRQRIAGGARPGSGPALTIGGDF